MHNYVIKSISHMFSILKFSITLTLQKNVIIVEDELHKKNRQINNAHQLFIGTVHPMVHIYIKHHSCDRNLEVT